jgi:hypothetical protein
MTKQNHKEHVWKNVCKPEDINLLAPDSAVEFGYILIFEYEDKRIYIGSTKKPTVYVNMILRRENKIGASAPINIRISPLVRRVESVKIHLLNKLTGYKINKLPRSFIVDDNVLCQMINETFALALIN